MICKYLSFEICPIKLTTLFSMSQVYKGSYNFGIIAIFGKKTTKNSVQLIKPQVVRTSQKCFKYGRGLKNVSLVVKVFRLLQCLVEKKL